MKKLFSSFAKIVFAGLVLGYSIFAINKSCRNDFRSFYNTGSLILTATDIYRSSQTDDGFFYSPPVALLMVPLSLLPQKAAAALWYLGNLLGLLILLAVAGYLLEDTETRAAGWRWLKERWKGSEKRDLKILWILTLLLTARFWLNNFEMGQINLALWSLTAISVYLAKTGRPVAGGAFLGLAITIKVLPILFLFYFFIKRNFRLVGSALLALPISFLLPSLFLGWEQNLNLLAAWYNKVIGPAAFQGAVDTSDMNQSLPALLHRFLSFAPTSQKTGHTVTLMELDPLLLDILVWAVSITGLGLLAFYARPPIRNAPGGMRPAAGFKENLEISLVFLSAVLLSPQAWKAYFVASLVPYAAAVYALLKMENGWFRRAGIFLIGLSFALHTLTADGIWGWEIARLLQAYSCVTFSILCLYLFLLLLLIRVTNGSAFFLNIQSAEKPKNFPVRG
ncbi:MAG: glycosyltransferase family 87 protein [Limisphaerales bacterium]